MEWRLKKLKKKILSELSSRRNADVVIGLFLYDEHYKISTVSHVCHYDMGEDVFDERIVVDPYNDCLEHPCAVIPKKLTYYYFRELHNHKHWF